MEPPSQVKTRHDDGEKQSGTVIWERGRRRRKKRRKRKRRKRKRRKRKRRKKIRRRP
jgi:hypothetical protein